MLAKAQSEIQNLHEELDTGLENSEWGSGAKYKRVTDKALQAVQEMGRNGGL
jgi:hypothetical protein